MRLRFWKKKPRVYTASLTPSLPTGIQPGDIIIASNGVTEEAWIIGEDGNRIPIERPSLRRRDDS